MKVQYYSIFLILILSIYVSECVENYLGTDVNKCINCLCHARSGCWSRFNCAKYSINFQYWKNAGSPTVFTEDDPDDERSYEKCMKNENCVVATIARYTESFGRVDCNCDGIFDCKDRFAIHIFGEDCVNPVFGQKYAGRFNDCARQIGVNNMLSSEGNDGCNPEPF